MNPDAIAIKMDNVAFNEAGELFGRNGVLECSFADRRSFDLRDRARYDRRAARLERDDLPVISGQHLWITDRLSHFYYHWFCDALPRLEAVIGKGACELPLLIPERVFEQQFVVESLEAWPMVTTICAGREGMATALSVAARAAETPKVNEPLARKTANRLVSRFRESSRGGRHRRIYVSRAAARTRGVINEQEILHTLARYGFEFVQMENLPLAEQISIMQATDILAGPHGGGLTNMMFMKPGASVLELRLESGPPACFRNLAAAMGHRWHALSCQPDDPQIHPHAACLRVDPLGLDRALTELGGKQGA